MLSQLAWHIQLPVTFTYPELFLSACFLDQVSYSDLYQMASAVAIEVRLGGCFHYMHTRFAMMKHTWRVPQEALCPHMPSGPTLNHACILS